MSNIPTQIRTIDPYSSYNSNIVNQLTRMVSRNTNCISGSSDSLNISVDPLIPLFGLTLSTGICFKDDVIIELPSSFNIDMRDVDFYLSSDHFDEAGYYYITLKYTYIKSKPAPQAEIVILKPSQHIGGLPSSAYLFLKAVYVDFIGGIFQIVSLHDFDPGLITVRREFVQIYFGVEVTLPTFTPSDEGRAIYVVEKDELFFGTSSAWESFNAIRVNADTLSCTVGQLAYFGSDGVCHPAIATDPTTYADGVVISVGAASYGGGKVRLYGEVANVPIQLGITVNVGDTLYLSDVTAGAVTNLVAGSYPQAVGTCISILGPTCTMWFAPGSTSSGGASTDLTYDMYQDLLLESIYKRLFLDTFINDDYIDSTSTITINPNTHAIDGVSGDVFYSNSLTDPGYDGTCIVSCQITATKTNSSNMLFYVSNNGLDDWEIITNFDQIHTFSTIKIPITINTGWLTIDEWVTGSSSGLKGVVKGLTTDYILLADIVGNGNWILGELITGDDSGLNVIVTGPEIARDNCTDLRLFVYWTGDASIQDYGILYDVDTEKDETSIANEKNIETLFADMYETPSLDNDGLRNYPFNDSTAFLNLNIVTRLSTIAKGIVDIDNTFGIGQLDPLDPTPSVADKKRNYLLTSDSTSLVVTDFVDPYDGQEITLIFSGAGTVEIQNGLLLHLAGGANYTMQENDTLTLIYVSSIVGWVEKCRSNN